MNQDHIKETVNIDSGQDISYQARLLVTSFKIRVFNLIVAMVLVYANKYIFGFRIVSYKVFIVLGAWLVVCLAYLLVFKFVARRSRKYLDNVHLSYYFPGVICASFLVYYMGSAAWIGFVIYLFDLIYGNVLMIFKILGLFSSFSVPLKKNLE